MTSGPIDVVRKFQKMQELMDSVKETEIDATFRFATLDIKEYYDQMEVEDAIDTIEEGFDEIRNQGQYFSIDKW